jgi:hypothetical protein
MKRIIYITFLFLLFLKTGGYYAFLKIQQYIVSEEVKEKIIKSLPAEKLVKLSFSRTDYATIDWEEEGKELIYEGKMYDLVRTVYDGKNYVLFCFSDKEESTIYQKILSFSKTQNDDFPVKKSLTACLQLLLIYHFEKPLFIKKTEQRFLCLHILYASIPKGLFIPPPEV